MKINSNKPPARRAHYTMLKTEGFKLKTRFCRPGRPQTISRVLVVDDHASLLRMFGDILQRWGFIAELIDPQFHIPDQIIRFMERDKGIKYDAIIMDGEMPGTSGADLVRILRARGFEGYIIANSGYPHLRGEMIEAGADFEMTDKSPGGFRDLFEVN